MAYFDGIKKGDKFYIGEKEFEVNYVDDRRFRGPGDLDFDFDGCFSAWPEFGQIAFWQPDDKEESVD